MGFDEAVALKCESKAEACGEKDGNNNIDKVVAPSMFLRNNSSKGRRGFELKKGHKIPANDDVDATAGEVGGRASQGTDANAATKEEGEN